MNKTRAQGVKGAAASAQSAASRTALVNDANGVTLDVHGGRM